MSDDFDLRSFAEDDDFFPFEEEGEDEAEDLGAFGAGGAEAAPFLGMTPIERMFLSIFLFMNVAILGVALLMATNRI